MQIHCCRSMLGSSLERPAGQSPLLFIQRGRDPATKQGLRGDYVDSSLLAQQDADLFGKVQRLKIFVCAASGIHLEHG